VEVPPTIVPESVLDHRHDRIVLVIELAPPLPSAYGLICPTHPPRGVVDIDGYLKRQV
jgi:hypothetical protein